ncbi:coiled-coil domain-containing protein 137 [Tribolium madens]|uniref:coiled-coil domain-containing protein 137 n=1 Tax=Tribolium madens TaxID=41895 RepID=UPI001CF74B5E|nr:coiled-coil domain-containing protein 137 [Tribolium madens]
MGRKIPGRKHRGVRDPEKQRAEREKSLKDKINAPPSNPDEQYVPKSLQRIAELQAKVKSGDFMRKKKKKPRPKGLFEQRPDESNREFLYRVHQHCAIVKHEAAFEQKFGVEIEKNAEGEIQGVKKRPKDPILVMIKEAKRGKKKKDEGPKLTKSQKRRLKLIEKKKKKMGHKVDEFDRFQDKVKFGEQVHEPPTLTAPRKVKKGGEAPRPGTKDLLLKSVLNKTVDKTGKRKDLPNALRRQLDKQQQEVIEAYRLLKGKKS